MRLADLGYLSCSLLLMLALGSPTWSQADPASRGSSSIVSDVVNKLVEHNQERADRLKYYTSQRHYHLQYKGFPHGAEASMDVEATYDAPMKKFRVVSETGSQKLINHVLKKLLTSEQEAAANQHDNALTPENYSFSLVDTIAENGQVFFVLRVEPKVAKKFLYRGKIWVDGRDYAVVKLEAEPSQNPSFWIRNTEIRHSYSQVGDFWLPTQSTTVTKVRLGGTATLTIDFGEYRLGTADDAQKAQAWETGRSRVNRDAFSPTPTHSVR